MTTPYHARFFANKLTRQGGEGVERLSMSLFDAQDAIDAQREELIANIEKQLKQRRSVQTVFCVRWSLT